MVKLFLIIWRKHWAWSDSRPPLQIILPKLLDLAKLCLEIIFSFSEIVFLGQNWIMRMFFVYWWIMKMFLLQLFGKFQSFHRFYRSPSFIPMLTKILFKLFFKAVILFALIIWSLGHFLLPDWCPLLTSWLIDRLKRRKSHKYIIVPYRYITLHYITYRYIHYMKRHYSMKLITLTTCDFEQY